MVKLHSKRVKIKTTLETSGDQNYTQNECGCFLGFKHRQLANPNMTEAELHATNPKNEDIGATDKVR